MTAHVNNERPATQYLRAITENLTGLGSLMTSIVAASEQGAERLVAGGSLYAVADEPGFVSEATGRSGGIRQIRNRREYQTTTLTNRDVILAGTLNNDPEQQARELDAFREQGALVVLFGSAVSPVCDHADILIDNGLPVGAVPVLSVPCRPEKVCPTGGIANITALWVFTCELIAACSRLGKTLAMYQSGGMPGGGARNNAYRDVMFHEDITIPSIVAGALGGQFLAEMDRCFTRISQQLPRFFQSGALIAQSLDSGHHVWVSGNGHYFAAQDGMPGDPRLFSLNMNGMNWNEAVAAFQQEDTFAYWGYYNFPEGLVLATRKARMHSIWMEGGCETGKFIARPQEILIDCGWKHGDACIAVPGYDIRVVPPSGVVQAAALWMLIGEAASQVRA
ncbi:MAG: hypothetical protein HY710_14020 [Candidatus Latescibacteria bacterium]|nr:hypothetical protein [Candidatus Latescibacterota bacterium]